MQSDERCVLEVPNGSRQGSDEPVHGEGLATGSDVLLQGVR